MNEELPKNKLEGGDKEKIEAAVQETLDWLKGKQLTDQATNEIDSLFEGIGHSCSSSRARIGECAKLLLPWAWWRKAC